MRHLSLGLPMSAGIGVGAVLCFAFALLYPLYSWSPLVNAKWSIIDDHQIVGWIGQRDRLPLEEVPAVLARTELGGDSDMRRFRPAYFALRTLEAALWGKRPALWYASRIAIAVIFALTLAWICLGLGGPILTLGFLTVALSRPYWVELFARLGPAETYAALGVSLTALGAGIGLKRYWSVPACMAVAFGIAIAAGSKENFIILGALPAWLVVSRTARIPASMRVLFVAVLAYLGWIVATVAGRLLAVGRDVYERDVSIDSRAGSLLPFLARSDVRVWLMACVGCYLVANLLRTSHPQRGAELPRLRSTLRNHALGMTALLVVFIAQYVFYGGHWPEGQVATRYLFPGILVEQLAAFLAVAAIVKGIAVWVARPAAHVVATAACLLGIAYVAGDLALLRKHSLQYAFNTGEFTQTLERAFAVMANDPAMALILNSHNPRDHGPVLSIETFVRSVGLQNPVAVKTNGYSPETFSISGDLLMLRLTRTLKRLEAEGGRGPKQRAELGPGFTPLDRVSGSRCLSFGLHGPPLAQCEARSMVWPWPW